MPDGTAPGKGGFIKVDDRKPVVFADSQPGATMLEGQWHGHALHGATDVLPIAAQHELYAVGLRLAGVREHMITGHEGLVCTRRHELARRAEGERQAGARHIKGKAAIPVAEGALHAIDISRRHFGIDVDPKSSAQPGQASSVIGAPG